MVFYYTSGNVKMMKNILNDYCNNTNDVSPFEYMETYTVKCPENVEQAKLAWIVDTFLGIKKHEQFLKAITTHMSEELTSEDQDYFSIIFYAVTFEIGPKDMPLLYKCLFNLSKSLLNVFTDFLSNNEVLTFISQVAQTFYDTSFITNKIVGPLFDWQPYISEMAHSYAEYVKKIETRKLKPPTVPVQPTVLTRKGKESASTPTAPSRIFPSTPPNSLRVLKGPKKMLTKSTIDQRLKNIHEKNKLRAENLLNNVKNNKEHYAQPKSEKYCKILSNVKETETDIGLAKTKISSALSKPRQKIVMKQVPVKETALTIKRMNKKMQQAEEEEIRWLENILVNCENTTKVDKLEEYGRQESEKQQLYDIERKHLEGLISYEEAIIAKKKTIEDNKKKYEEFLQERQLWMKQLENWKQREMEKNRKNFEKLSLIELNILQAKNDSTNKKKELAQNVRKESEALICRAMKERKDELEQKINMVKEIKILSLIARKSRLPKIIDLTETSGIGLLCEMSMAELQERLNMMKIGLTEELEKKKKQIKDSSIAEKQDLEDTKIAINNYLNERTSIKKQRNKKTTVTLDESSSKEINNLKKVLEEKRKLRATV